MKRVCLTLIISLGAVIAVSAETVDTLDFSPGLLLIDELEQTVRYGSLEMVADNDRPSVPIKKLFYHSKNGSAEVNLYCRVLKADTLELGFEPAINDLDQITSEFRLSIPRANYLPVTTYLYPAGIYQVTGTKIDDRLVYSLSIYPVQFLENRKVIFNRQIEICTDGETAGLEPGAGKSEDHLFSFDPDRFNFASSVNENGCPLGGDLVIVTSPALAEAFEEMADLKRRTGFAAAVALTDSIYRYYGGIDEPEKIRNYLSDFHDAGGRWVILGGDEDNVPVRYAYYYNTDTQPDLYYNMICDMYFADYDGDWDFDGDGVWGEPSHDHPDQGPEVSLGRLPFGAPDQVRRYTNKLETYLFNPGGGDPSYLNSAAFLTSDQMRDYFENGQQYPVAENFPPDFVLNLEGLSESPTGDDPAPTGPSADDAVTAFSNGFGMINILAHGRPDGFILNSSGYNQSPKTYMLTGSGHVTHAGFETLAHNQNPAFYYSISCEQGAFDLESLYGMVVPSVVEELLALDSSGAIGMVAFSRWGWVASSYKLMASFYSHLFNEADGYPVEAMYASWLDYPYYRDQIYGQNYYGDPSISIYPRQPAQAEIIVPDAYYPSQPIQSQLTIDGTPLADYPLTVLIGEDDYQTVISDADGNIEISLPEKCTEDVRLTLFTPGQISDEKILRPALLSDVDDDTDPPLPREFKLGQNYPNPFNPNTTIGFTLPRSEHVSLTVYNILGRVVTVLLDEMTTSGEHELVWDGFDRNGRPVATGVYFYRLMTADRTETKKMVLIK